MGRRVSVLAGLNSVLLLVFLASAARGLDVPVRIKMGGNAVVDSFGRPWLGDGGTDPLNIRPDDAGGANTIPAWCTPSAGSVSALGYNPAVDSAIFTSIRWDNGLDAFPYVIELPIPDDTYDVSLFLCESCCLNRHEKIEIQDVLVAADVHPGMYAGGTQAVGRLLFEDIVVAAGILKIELYPCLDPECPGGGDNNPILSAIEVQPSSCAPCCDPKPRLCPSGLVCAVEAGGAVAGSWQGPRCFDVTGYSVYRDGSLLASLPPTATGFTDSIATRTAYYEVVAEVGAGETPCSRLTCLAVNTEQPFDVPLRINMGDTTVYDSLGRQWLGDGPGAGDPLGIRPNDAGGTNTIPGSWCFGNMAGNADSLQSLGLDPFNPGDQAIFNTIRWDLGNDAGGAIDYDLELPVDNGSYDVSLFFTECCCPNRHFKVEVQGTVIDDDVSTADYSVSGALGRTGRLRATGIAVTDGLLRISILPTCVAPDCPAGIDNNAILDAIEVLAAGTAAPRCPQELICTVEADGSIKGTWTGPQDVTLGGYALVRNGAPLTTLPGDATEFVDPDPPCSRVLIYELRPVAGGPDFLCPELVLRCVASQIDCPFETPVRINMGGAQFTDSNGNIWLGDGPGAGDPLQIRPVDAGGNNWVDAGGWCANPAADSMTALGFDPTNPLDREIFGSIRWDNGGDPSPFLMEFPVADGDYLVNMYFCEACCPQRHFKARIEGVTVDADISSADYGGVGRLALLGFPQSLVLDGALTIELLPCPECPGQGDTNAIINALEIIRTGDVPTLQLGGDCNQDGVLTITDLVCGVSLLYPTFNLLSRTPQLPPCADGPGNLVVLDVNGSGSLSSADIASLASFLFLGGSPPAQGLGCFRHAALASCATNPACD
jgi:hypothetical protein